jgi:hypothetical protein
MNKPGPHEYDLYYDRYVSLVAGNDVMMVLDKQPADLRSLFRNVPDERGGYAYADGKWTIKELLSHIIDGERIFAYRLLRISRGDKTPIEGFEQDDYIENSNANNRTISELLDEFDLQRRSNMMLIRNLSEDGLSRIGTASERPISARAVIFILAGHVEHHVAILKQRYLT